MIVESLLTQKVRDSLDDRFSHYDDFDELPGQVMFMMTLDTVNASAELDVKGAKMSFKSLSLSNYPGENVTEMATIALKYIKIVRGD